MHTSMHRYMLDLKMACTHAQLTQATTHALCQPTHRGLYYCYSVHACVRTSACMVPVSMDTVYIRLSLCSLMLYTAVKPVHAQCKPTHTTQCPCILSAYACVCAHCCFSLQSNPSTEDPSGAWSAAHRNQTNTHTAHHKSRGSHTHSSHTHRSHTNGLASRHTRSH